MPVASPVMPELHAAGFAEGETFLGAIYVVPAGRFGRSVGFSAAGIVGGAVAEYATNKRRSGHGEELGAGLAGSVPDTDVVLAVTDRLYLVFSFGRVKGFPRIRWQSSRSKTSPRSRRRRAS